MGGLFGLGANIAGMAFSDKRLKSEIEPMGITANGFDLYRYRYIWEPVGTRRVGVMADEVARTKPEAVASVGGYDAVDYTTAMAA